MVYKKIIIIANNNLGFTCITADNFPKNNNFTFTDDNTSVTVAKIGFLFRIQTICVQKNRIIMFF